MNYNVYSISSKSSFHEKNEDHYLVGDDYIIIADGMGGEADGDIASKIAVDTIHMQLVNLLPSLFDEVSIREALRMAIENADSALLKYIGEHPDSVGMGTTVLIVCRKGDRCQIGWCGDSHGYSFNKGTLKSLTKDHSYIQELIDRGDISVEDAFSHPDNNLISRYVGGGDDVCTPDFCQLTLAPTELIILCSDGLSGYCKTDDIENTIKSNRNISHLPDELRELAISKGSDDDITVVVLAPDTCKCGSQKRTFFSSLRSLFCG